MKPIDGHTPQHRRKTLGRHPITNRTLYGWDARCECGWSYFSNENKRRAEELHRAHLRDVFGRRD